MFISKHIFALELEVEAIIFMADNCHHRTTKTVLKFYGKLLITQCTKGRKFHVRMIMLIIFHFN